VVFIIWATEGRFPPIYALRNPDDLDEERRLLYVAATLFYQSSLFGLIHYVAPWSDRFIMPNITVPGSAMIICYLLFTVFFLETEHTAPRCNIVLRSLVACNFIFIAMMFLGFQWLANLLTYLGATVAVIAVFITALSSLRSGYLPARYFIIAAGVFLASSMIFLLKFYGVLPSNTLTMNIMFFGSSAESILLSQGPQVPNKGHAGGKAVPAGTGQDAGEDVLHG
jgi:hypothetical protein